MKVLVLTNNENSKELIDWLAQTEEIVVMQDRINLEMVKQAKPDFIVSYNYNYLIKQDVLDAYPDKVINMHISYLPWNRGFSPNFWSFMEDTRKGVTIHYVDQGLDTGDILVQREMVLSEEDTFSSTYEMLNAEIRNLFYENWKAIRDGKIKPVKQQGQYSYHTKADLDKVQKELNFQWTDTIKEVKEKYLAYK